mmetsp:Transcript_18633/g.47868  ORF Transcript_18633/g.47868 Transcript_18633/m.47868 type:complete len:918 (+) Transcript_18633:109-2862(+)
MRERTVAAGAVEQTNVWHMKRYLDGDAEHYEEFALTLSFAEPPNGGGKEAAATGIKVAGHLAPCGGDAEQDTGELEATPGVALDGELTKVALRLEHKDPVGGELCVYRSERFVTEGDGQFRGVWMCGARTGRFSAARRKSPEEPRKRKSACRRKADAEIKSKRFFNDLKDELLILDRLGWTEKRWKEESKLEKGRAILRELRRELGGVLSRLGLRFEAHTPWLQRVERGIEAARRDGDAELLRRLRAVDCSASAPADDCRSDWHTLFEIQRHFGALPPFRATKFLEPSNVRHALRCAEIKNRAVFEHGLHIGGARHVGMGRMPASRGLDDSAQANEIQRRVMEELRHECLAGDEGVFEAYNVHIQLVVRAGCSDFIWEPGAEVKLYPEDRVYYEQAHVWNEERRMRSNNEGQRCEEMTRRLVEFESMLTGGHPEHVYEEDFEFVEMTARAESGAAEGVPAFLEHSVTGSTEDAEELFERVGRERGWTHRPKALNLVHLFKTRLAGYRHQRTREIVWGPGPDLYWERGDRPLRLLRMAQEPVRVAFCRSEEPYGFHVQDLRGGAGGVEVVEVAEGSPADARGVVVGRTVKRLIGGGQSEDVRHWSRAQIEEAISRMPDRFTVEFGKGDTEERRHAPLGDAEMAILMDERFMRGFLHELWQNRESGASGESLVDHEGWALVFPGLEPSSPGAAPPGPEGLSGGPSGASAGSTRRPTAASGSSAGSSAAESPPPPAGTRTAPASPPPPGPPPPPPVSGQSQPLGPCPATSPTQMPFWTMPCDSAGSLAMLPPAAPLASWGLPPRGNSPMRVPLPTSGVSGGMRHALEAATGPNAAPLPEAWGAVSGLGGALGGAPGLSLPMSGSAAAAGIGRGGGTQNTREVEAAAAADKRAGQGHGPTNPWQQGRRMTARGRYGRTGRG